MASQKRRGGGRTTPKGTKPGRVHETHRLDTSDPHSMHGQNIADASSRYTPPTLREQRVSPPWVPVLMFALLGLGALVILLYYLGFVPGGRNNWYLFSGLLAVLGGLYTATKYH
ncbi:MAG: cell division protein CrgA [Acidimicrobiaceae bacterium]